MLELLLNKPELFVGVVEATVKADFGLHTVAVLTGFFSRGASFLALTLKLVIVLVIKSAGLTASRPFFCLYCWSAEVSVFC